MHAIALLGSVFGTYLTKYKYILIPLLNDCKSDKCKPVREVTSDALALVRQIPEPQERYATFSQRNEMDDFAK